MRILLTEDDSILATLLHEALTYQHHVVDVAADGEIGWEYTQSLTYDMILLDIDLPKLDGLSLCQRLRNQGYPGPIILLTARHRSGDKVEGLDAGADDYLVKPFTVEELNARMRAVMRRRESYKESRLIWGQLCLNPATCEVTFQGSPLSLSGKEYSLLELFLRHPQRIFSSSHILDHLWSFPDCPGEDTVRAHIKRLRQKLKRAGVEEMIETIYGMGYRLKPAETSPMTEPEPTQSLEAETQAAIAMAWETFKQPIQERLRLLAEMIAALSQNSVSEDQRQQGREIAHKLVGSLGMFGYRQGSEWARAMEQILLSETWQEQKDQLRSHLTQLQTLLFMPEEAGNQSPPSQPEVADELTGLMRRHHAIRELQHQLDSYPQTLTLALIDIDNFQEINIQGGYTLGDQVLQKIAQLLSATFPPKTLMARWGDDEFLLALLGWEAATAENRLQPIALAVYQLKWESWPALQVTLTMGFAQFPDQGQQLEKLMSQVQQQIKVKRRSP